MKGVHISPPMDTCVMYGCVIPEGRRICPSCEKAWGIPKLVQSQKQKKIKLRKNNGKKHHEKGNAIW